MTQEIPRNTGNGQLPTSDARFDAPFSVSWTHRLRVTQNVFDPANPVLSDVFRDAGEGPFRTLVVIDQGVANAWPDLPSQLTSYAASCPDLIKLAGDPVTIPGGETCKNGRESLDRIVQAVESQKICRQSFIIAIGGGAVLDVAGFAAATSHRGVRLIRLPTTTLAQADSGIGVKNGINALGKKNFLGTFMPPFAVINDEAFLSTLCDRHFRSGLSECVKVALVKDASYFRQIESAIDKLNQRDTNVARPIIRRSAELHLNHIVSGGDPFELTTARPLDFGHWAAHKLEQMTDFQLTHGEAVAIGIALDSTYSEQSGLLVKEANQRILASLSGLGFTLFNACLQDRSTLFQGLEEFREHLGGQLTIPLLTGIGKQIDVHEIDLALMTASIESLAQRAKAINAPAR